MARNHPGVHVIEGPALQGEAGELRVNVLVTEAANLGPKDRVAQLRPVKKQDLEILKELERGAKGQKEAARVINQTKSVAQ